MEDARSKCLQVQCCWVSSVQFSCSMWVLERAHMCAPPRRHVESLINSKPIYVRMLAVSICCVSLALVQFRSKCRQSVLAVSRSLWFSSGQNAHSQYLVSRSLWFSSGQIAHSQYLVSRWLWFSSGQNAGSQYLLSRSLWLSSGQLSSR